MALQIDGYRQTGDVGGGGFGMHRQGGNSAPQPQCANAQLIYLRQYILLQLGNLGIRAGFAYPALQRLFSQNHRLFGVAADAQPENSRRAGASSRLVNRFQYKINDTPAAGAGFQHSQAAHVVGAAPLGHYYYS